MSDKALAKAGLKCIFRDKSSTMALRMLTEKITTAAARQYQKIVATELNQFGTSKFSIGGFSWPRKCEQWFEATIAVS